MIARQLLTTRDAVKFVRVTCNSLNRIIFCPALVKSAPVKLSLRLRCHVFSFVCLHVFFSISSPSPLVSRCHLSIQFNEKTFHENTGAQTAGKKKPRNPNSQNFCSANAKEQFSSISIYLSKMVDCHWEKLFDFFDLRIYRENFLNNREIVRFL